MSPELLTSMEPNHDDHEHDIGSWGEYCPDWDVWIFGPYDEEES